MSETKTKTESKTTSQAPPREAENKGDVAIFQAPRLPFPPQAVLDNFEIGKPEWRALTDAIFPAAKTVDSICLALAYCKRRNLDPFKRVVHIVPCWNSALRRVVETVWPGIGELRTTAFRTRQYAGADETVFGPMIEHTFVGGEGDDRRQVTVTFPEWAQVTVYRMIFDQRVAFPGPRCYWTELFAHVSHKVPVPNERWCRAPSGQLEKCAEAAALRKGFPEELGDEASAEEMEGQIINQSGEVEQDAPPRPTRQPAGTVTDVDPDGYSVVDADGEVTEFSEEAAAANHLLGLLRHNAKTLSVLRGLYESNADVIVTFDTEIAAALAGEYEKLVRAHAPKPAASTAAKKEPEKSKEGPQSDLLGEGAKSPVTTEKPAGAPPAAPVSPLARTSGPKANWGVWIDWLKKELQQRPADKLSEFIATFTKECDYVAESWPDDWQEIEDILNRRKKA